MQYTIRSIPEARLTGMILAEQTLTWPIIHDQVRTLLAKLTLDERLAEIMQCMLLSCAEGIIAPSSFTLHSRLVMDFVETGAEPGQFGHWLGSHIHDGTEDALTSAYDLLETGLEHAAREQLDDDPHCQPYVIALAFACGILSTIIERSRPRWLQQQLLSA